MGAVAAETQQQSRKGDEKQYQKGVQHLSEMGISKVPTKYILPLHERPFQTKHAHEIPRTDDADGLLNKDDHVKLPVIDFAELQGPNRSKALKILASACADYGFFQLVNHGVAMDTMSGMIDVGRRFFGMPMEERAKYMSGDMHAPVRYGTSFNQNKDRVFCWRDFLKVSCSHPSAGTLWPISPADLREKAVTYSKETKDLFMRLVEAILETLGVWGTTSMANEDGDDILKQFKKGSQLMVVNCFPPCPEPNLTLGMPPHSDYAFLTLLLSDHIPGLQIQHREKWLSVRPIPNSFVVNVGDHLEIFSNGRYKSVLHRVVTNAAGSRISVASLHSLPFDCAVEPFASLVDDMNPKRYKETDFASFLDYISSREPKKKDFLESRKLVV